VTCKRTARRPPERLRLTLDSLAFGGDAVARAADGRVVFVPGGAPGDSVLVEVEDEHKAWLRARLMRVVTPGATRREPPCPAFVDGCGGCQWLHVTIEAQRAAKEDVVRRALRNVAAQIEPIQAPGPELHWRRRARLRWRGQKIGYTRHRSHELVDVASCPQLEEPLDRALAAVRAALLGELDGAGEIELLLTRSKTVHVALAGPHVAALRGAAERLLGQAAIQGVLVGDVVLGADRVDLGDGDRPFWARADLFAQASAPGNDLLRALVREAAGSLEGRRVLELFAGSGNFTRDLLAAGADVVAVEESAPAAALAAENLAGWVDRLTLVGRAAEPLPDEADATFDLVVVDPPRTGLAPGLSAAIAALGVPVLYVSCDPQTLGRDLTALGRPVARVVPVDLMPQTFHVEIVAVTR
jgi:23S rRNA (uracil1939-C5)-methyltransferase